ncbi:MAG: phenylalanine--tRNA ligase subunit beta [Flavobacteriaceae bacterium]|jgi:phenylalanyl-tRNA synthetase beta chain|nr:phenylalanine--tRNA ligase subunit beta [Flavobacteriaceae bacterium]
MKISYNWLSSHIKTDLEVQKIGEILTNTGLEVEAIEKCTQSHELNGVVVGKVIALEKHPNADKLKIATVDIGSGENLQIVCGAPNIEEEQKVPVATVGTILPAPDGTSFAIKEAKLRGVESFGMICSEAELGVSENNEGIWVLEPSHKIGTPVKDFIKKNNSDVLIEIGLTPNRTDAMSHYGVARDLHAALNVLKQKSELTPISSESFDNLKISGKNPIEVEIKNPELAPRYAGLYLENIEVKPSPEWIQEKLKTIGLNPINNVVDITNYILHDLGQPLHAFDAEKISGKKIIVQQLPAGTEFTTLDGVNRKLNGSELMICDENGGMCMAGIYGGMNSGVTETTKSIFLESAYFDPVSIRKSSKAHGLNTDSSFRFERGVDPNMTLTALKKAAMMLAEFAGAEIQGEIFDFYPAPIENFKTVLRYHKLDQLLGERLHREQVKGILELLDIQIVSESNETLEVSIPPYRADVQREVDVIEEILRIYGYNKIKTPEKISFTPVKNTEKDAQKIENAIAQTLIARGFHEAMNNSVVKSGIQQIYGLDESKSVKLLNPLSSDLSVMRQSMLSGLLENTAYNINRKTSDIKLFEFGKIYNKTEEHQENYRLAILMSGNKSHENWATQEEKTNFFTLKGKVSEIFKRLGIHQIEEKPYSNLIYSDALSLEKDGKTLGSLGKIHKNILKKTDISQEVFYAELNWELMLEIAISSQLKFKEIAKFPAVNRDLALLIDQNILYSELYNSTQNLNISLLKSMELFDVYEGDKLPEGKKSYAMSFVLQNEEKTLSDVEIENVMNELIRNFQQNFNAELRN